MKRYLQLLFVILFPYLNITLTLLLFMKTAWVTTVLGHPIWLSVILLAAFLIALVSSIVVLIVSLVNRWDALKFARLNMVIKLIHIPAYLIIFLFGVASFITIFTFAFSAVFVVLDCLTICLTGIIGLASVIRSVAEKKLSITAGVVHGILQFIFCADVVSAVILYITVNKSKSLQV